MSKNKGTSVKPAQERVDAGLVEEDFKLMPRDEADADGELHDHDLLDENAYYAERAGAAHPSPTFDAPSTRMNPYVSEGEQGMEMQPTVVGPPGYGSPDPLTSAGKLLPLEQHPLRADALPEGHPAAISEDFGEGYGGTLSGASTVMQQPNASDLDRHSRGDFSVEANDEVDATGAAKELANENSVDLSQVEGTGADGRVTKDDVQKYLDDNDETA